MSELDQTNPFVKIRFTLLQFFKMTILISILLIHLVYTTKDVERHHRVGYSLPYSEETLKISVSSNLMDPYHMRHVIWEHSFIKVVRGLFNLCMQKAPEVECLRMIFDHDHFWL